MEKQKKKSGGKVVKIMFICTGNICRSAMAEAMLKKMIEGEENIEVCSAGIYADTGDIPTQDAIEVMKDYNIDLTKHRATNIQDSEIEKMDLILCATRSHKLAVIQEYPNLKDKVYTIKEYAGFSKEGNNFDISDPWGYNKKVYEECAKEIYTCLEIIKNKLLEENNKEQ